MSISAGLLNSWVVLQKPSTDKDALGGVKTNYTDIAKIRANVTKESVGVVAVEKQVQNESLYNVKIRSLKGVFLDTFWRILIDDKIMSIEGVNHLIDMGEIEILARFKSSGYEQS